MADPGQPPFLYMAPLKGITDARFRRIFHRHFGGIDTAIAPFVNPQKGSAYPDKLIKDLLPEINAGLPLIPQLLNNEPTGFIALARRMEDLGYREINWNLGCPVKMVTGKKRGSGLLPYPDRIIELLENVVPHLGVKLSIKMRLGYDHPSESARLLPRLDDFDLSEIIIHARLGKQLYRGPTLPEAFGECIALTRHRLVYNGDLVSVQAYRELKEMYPGVERFMIGRGLLADPFLPAAIKNQSYAPTDRAAQLSAFHDELFQAMQEDMSGPGHLLGRMKQIWLYFIGAFPGKEKLLKKILRASSEKRYLAAARKILAD
jgi:tRNA-dihydrouridine synthase